MDETANPQWTEFGSLFGPGLELNPSVFLEIRIHFGDQPCLPLGSDEPENSCGSRHSHNKQQRRIETSGFGVLRVGY